MGCRASRKARPARAWGKTRTEVWDKAGCGKCGGAVRAVCLVLGRWRDAAAAGWGARPEPGSVTRPIAESAEGPFGPRVWCSACGERLLLPSPIQRPRAPAPLRLAVLLSELHQLLDRRDPRLGLPWPRGHVRAQGPARLEGLRPPIRRDVPGSRWPHHLPAALADLRPRLGQLRLELLRDRLASRVLVGEPEDRQLQLHRPGSRPLLPREVEVRLPRRERPPPELLERRVQPGPLLRFPDQPRGGWVHHRVGDLEGEARPEPGSATSRGQDPNRGLRQVELRNVQRRGSGRVSGARLVARGCCCRARFNAAKRPTALPETERAHLSAPKAAEVGDEVAGSARAT